MKVTVYLRPETILVLLARKDKTQTWLACRLGIHVSMINRMINEQQRVPIGMQERIFDTFRGMSHKPGGRLTKDDLFRYDLTEGAVS